MGIVHPHNLPAMGIVHHTLKPHWAHFFELVYRNSIQLPLANLAHVQAGYSIFLVMSENAFPRKWVNQKTNATTRKYCSRAFQ
jgi:hypothetical protein